jgi:hypothetical protein
MGDLYGLDITEYRLINQIAPLKSIFEREILQLIYHLFECVPGHSNSFCLCLFQ